MPVVVLGMLLACWVSWIVFLHYTRPTIADFREAAPLYGSADYLLSRVGRPDHVSVRGNAEVWDYYLRNGSARVLVRYGQIVDIAID